MKSARPLLLILGSLAGLLLLAVVLVRLPAVQGWALRRALAGQADAQIEFARISAGLSSAEITGVRVSRSGLRVEVPRLEVEYAAWGLLGSGPLRIARLHAHDIVVDASRLQAATGAASAGAPAAAPGAVAQIHLPFGLVLDGLDLSGRVLLPGPDAGSSLPARFTFEGGGIAPGQQGGIRLRLQVDDTRPDARVTALRLNGTLQVRQTTARSFDRVQLDLQLDAEGPALTRRQRLQLAASLEAAGESADYAVKLDTFDDGVTSSLLRLNARQTKPTAPFAGDWEVKVRSAQVEPFYLGGALPQFSLEGDGRFTLQPANGAVAVAGSWSGEISTLEVLDPALRPLGALKFSAELDVADTAGITQVNKFRLRLDGAEPVLSAETHGSILIDRGTRQLQIGGAATGEVGRFTLHRVPLAWIRPFVRELDISGGALSGDFSLSNGSDELRLRSVAPLRLDSLTLVRDGRLLLERAALNVHLAAALAPGLARLELTGLDFRTAAGDRLQGSLALQSPFAPDQPASWRAALTADLPALLGPLTGVGHVKVSAELEAATTSIRVELRTLRGELADGAGRRLAGWEALAPFALDLEQGRLVPAGSDLRALLRLGAGPFRFADLPLPGAKETLRGELAATEFTLSARGEQLELRTAAPLRVQGFGLRQDGHPVVDDLVIELSPAIDFRGVGDWAFRAPAGSVRSSAGLALATLGAEVSATASEGLRAALTFQAELAALSAQPALANLRALSAGRASGEIRVARSGGAWQAEARSTLNGLVAREGNQPLPVANLSARAIRHADGRITFEAPLLLDRSGRRSDLRLTAEAARSGGDWQFEAALAGQQVELLDLLGLATLAGGAPAAPADPMPVTPANPAARTADSAPFWRGWRGRLTLDLASLSRGDNWKVTGLTGRATVGADRLVLEKFEGAINERGRVAAEAALAFTRGARPYALSGNFSVTEFDLGALLKELEPDRVATIDGLFSVNGRFTGDGADLERTLERTRGQFQLTGRQGAFRGLRRSSEKVSVASRAVELGAALGSLFGSNKVREAAEKVAGQAYQVDQAAQLFAELPYDQLVVRLTRAENLNLTVEEFALLSPEVRLTGRGTITHIEGRPLPQQPLALTLTLAGRGKVEQQLGRLRVLDGTKDELGYARMRDSLSLGGTLLRPDPSAFFARLLEQKAADFLAPGN